MYKLCRNLVFHIAHFQIFWHWLILCKSMFTPDLSDWMAYHAPLIPWFWTFSWLCASNVCTPFRCSYAFYAKIHIFLHTSITEDNAYMWLPLALQVQYLDFYICFIALRVVPRDFLCPQITVFNNMSVKLVHCIRNSLNAKRLVHFMVNFMFLCISSNWQWFESFPIELKVVITKGFSFICFRTVEAWTPY